jgi:DNA-binding transcriptional LysR family regulator
LAISSSPIPVSIRHKKGVAPTASISKNIIRADEHFIPLWVERYVAALPPSHPLTLKEKLRTSDLAGVAMIDRCHCEQSEFFGRAASPSRQPAAMAESEDWTMALVAAGVGIAIVPEGVARANPDVAVREIDVDVKREVGWPTVPRVRRQRRCRILSRDCRARARNRAASGWLSPSR